jgi:predicted small secreted protein
MALRLHRRLLLACLLLAACTIPAAAHHGWAWTQDQPFTLTGTIEDIYIGQPHATLTVRAEDGLWQVDLAPLGRTLRAGFGEDAAKVGDAVTCIGYRSSNSEERHMKAARIIVNGRTYDVYPDRVPPG